MKALVYHGPGQKSWETVPDPVIQEPTDAIVRIDTTTICGTDLHILKGDVPAVMPGTILGHEAVGTIIELGTRSRARASATASWSRASRRAVAAVLQAGPLRPVHGRRRLDLRPPDRRRAGRVRAGPVRRHLRYKIPEGLTDEQVLFLADILPTAYEVGILNGEVKPGDIVAIVGAGPIGLAADLDREAATRPATIVVLDVADARLELAKEFGADVTINNGTEDAVAKIMELTEGRGADVAIEAVGVPATFELCSEM